MLCKICGKLVESQYETGGVCENCWADDNGHAHNIYREDEKPLEDMTQEERLALPISYLEIDQRAANRLFAIGYKTLGDLAKKTAGELIRVGDFGQKSANKVIDSLRMFGIRLREDS